MVHADSLEDSPPAQRDSTPAGRRLLWRVLLAAVLLTVILASWFLQRYGPGAVARQITPESSLMLTWDGDPTSSMTMLWVDQPDAPAASVRITGPGIVGAEVLPAGEPEIFPRTDLLLYRVQIADLLPDSEYQFQLVQDRQLPEPAQLLRFRTAPVELDEPVTFVVGGDADSTAASERVADQAASHAPLFAVLGGDLAYENGVDADQWLRFMMLWRRHMVTDQQRLIPLLACIGNHEVAGSFNQPASAAPFFHATFQRYRPRSYDAIDFGAWLSLIMLDSHHTATVEGAQTAWLKTALEQRQDQLHVFPIYHVPAWPSARPPDRQWPHLIVREHWTPLFDRFNIPVAFEHHEHAYKRTHPIRGGVIDPDGTVYLGDGAWGVTSLRYPYSPEDLWYLARTRSVHHFFLVTLTSESRSFRAIDDEGNEFDHLVQSPVRKRARTPAGLSLQSGP